MQKWIGIGRIDGEPMKVKYGEQEYYLLWIACPRSWAPKKEDSIPVMLIGKRKNVLKQASTDKLDGSLVYVIGEIASRIKLNTPKAVNIGVCVFATSITFWDTENIQRMQKGKVNNELIFDSTGLEEMGVTEVEEV